MARRIVNAAGFSVTTQDEKESVTKFHVTTFDEGKRQLWVTIPGETRFEFVTLPEPMSKEDARRYVSGLERFQAENYQNALKLDKLLELVAGQTPGVTTPPPVRTQEEIEAIRAANLEKIKALIAKRENDVAPMVDPETILDEVVQEGLEDALT